MIHAALDGKKQRLQANLHSSLFLITPRRNRVAVCIHRSEGPSIFFFHRTANGLIKPNATKFARRYQSWLPEDLHNRRTRVWATLTHPQHRVRCVEATQSHLPRRSRTIAKLTTTMTTTSRSNTVSTTTSVTAAVADLRRKPGQAQCRILPRIQGRPPLSSTTRQRIQDPAIMGPSLLDLRVRSAAVLGIPMSTPAL